MRREEKRRKLHESLLNTLYPPEPQSQSKSDDETRTTTTTFDVNLIPDDYGLRSASTSDNDDGGESESEKLTRAQRKRRRKKKLKEDNSRRKQLIGPLKPLPSDASDGGSAGEKCTPPVRQNADESCGAISSQRKVKHRRMSKKLVKERLIKPSDINGENFDDDRKPKTKDS